MLQIPLVYSAVSRDWSAAFGGTGDTEAAASKQKPVSKSDRWSDSTFGSQPQQQKEQKQPADSSFSGFRDNWSGFPEGGNATASANPQGGWVLPTIKVVLIILCH